MKTVTARELKNRTGEVLREVGRGTKVLVTRRGKAFAMVSPVEGTESHAGSTRPFEEAWADIEEALRRSRPRHTSWQEAMRWSRRRP